MEEAEAVSDRLTIMVRGLFKCFGTLQNIRHTYGQGFEIYFTLDMDVINAKLFVQGKGG
jgi:hypothetical protein